MNLKQLCENHIHRYVLVKTVDNHEYDGIIESIDNKNLYLAVPNGNMEREKEGEYDEQWFLDLGFPYYGSPYYGYPFYSRPTRFRRLTLPLASLSDLSLLPYY